MLIGTLYWARWPERPAVRRAIRLGWIWWLGAAALGLAALPLLLLLAPFPLWPAPLWAYTALLVCAALAAASALGGFPGARWLANPLIILPGALPWLSLIDQHLVFPLREKVAEIAAEACNMLGRPALASGAVIRLGGAWLGVDEACGGIRSLQASVMVALFFGEWFRLPWGRRAGLVGIGAAAAVLGNLARVMFLALQAARGTAAFHAAHDPAGWLALAFSLSATGLVARHWARRGRGARAPGPRAGLAGGDPGPVGIWVCLAAGLLLADEAAVRWWYARGEAAHARAPHWIARLPVGRPDFRPAPLTGASREILKPDFYEAGSWRAGGGPEASAYYIEWRRGSTARFIPFLHNPTVCLPMAGCELVESLGVVPVAWEGGVIPFHCYIFRASGEEMTVAFTIWDTARDRPLERPPEFTSWADWFQLQWADVREARLNQPAQLLSFAVDGRMPQERLAAALRALLARPQGT
jgi:exosortase